MPDSGVGRIRAEIVAVFPIKLRPDGPGTKTAAAIRTDIAQDVFGTRTTEGAFKRANHRVRGIGRQRRVAILASRSQFEHSGLLMCAEEGCRGNLVLTERGSVTRSRWGEAIDEPAREDALPTLIPQVQQLTGEASAF